MCGICAIHRPDGLRDAEPLLVGMTDLMRHRGPDDRGTYCSEGAAIAMRRLSIIDLLGGHQPIGNERGDVWVVCNGEIYNYVELREDLRSAGHTFATGSDTEVLVHLYEEQGDRFVELLNGMFALALLDVRRRRLLVARDRIGKKPLFYTQFDGATAFSSEIKPLLQLTGRVPPVDATALNLLLQFNYVPAPLTIFEGIRHVRPGHLAVVDGGGFCERPFWRIRDRIDPEPRPVSAPVALERVEALLDDAVRLRMRSDVPVGLFLSGGVDSSLVTSRMMRHASEPVRSFSIGFHHQAYDESAHAAAVAAAFGTQHRLGYLDPGETLDLYPEVLWHLEQPHGDTSFVPTYLLSKMASRDVRVVLTGDGGDEVFGGYTRYLSAWRRAADIDPARVLADALSAQDVFDADLRRRILRPSLFADLPGRTAGTAATPDAVVRELMLHDVVSLLPDNNVVKPDRMAMAWSVEARSPLLDYRLVEYALSLPGGLHVRSGDTKVLLRALMAQVLPAPAAGRAKQQFTVPFGDWLRADADGRIRRVFERLLRREWFEPAPLRELWSAHADGRANHTRQLRLLVALELWASVFIDVNPLAGRPAAAGVAGQV